MIEYPSDCREIIKVIKEEFGKELSMIEANELWKSWSDRVEAGWLFTDKSGIMSAYRWWLGA